MSDLKTEIVLLIFAAAGLTAGTILGVEGQTVGCVALISTSALIAVVAGVGPKSILEIRSGKGGFSVERGVATRKNVRDSLSAAAETPNLPEEKIKEVTQKAESRPENQRTDADYLVLAMAAHRNDDPDEELGYAYAGLSVPSSGRRVRARLIDRKGTAFRKLDLKKKALELYGEAIEVDPSFSWPHTSRGNVLRDLKRYDEALAAHNEAIQLDPTDTFAHNYRGVLFQKLGRQAEAAAAFARTKELDQP